MARTLLTPFKTTAMATGAVMLYTAAGGSHGEKMTTAGAYVKTGGASRIDPSRLLFIVSVNSSKYTTAGIVSVVSGSTAGKSDYFPGAYSTLNNLNITIPVASGHKYGGISGHANLVPFMIPEAAKFCDTDDYIKFNISSAITSKGSASLGGRIMVLYLKSGGH